MDKELVTICEFVSFAKEIMKGDKGVKNLYRLIGKPTDLTPQQVTQIKQVFSTFFSSVVQWQGFSRSALISYKTGTLSMGALEAACSAKPEDKQVFEEYMTSFKAIYLDIRRNLTEFITKLNLEEGSPEAGFMSNLFNEIGGEIIETIKSGGGTKDIASLLPKVFEMVKSGKILQILERLKDGSIKISKILKAFVLLVEQYEQEGNVQVASEGAVSTSLVE
jgi:hypothetical protein